MNRITRPERKKTIHTGALVFGAGRDLGENSGGFAKLFRCRKNGFDFLGQIRIGSNGTPPQLEMLNDAYFSQFDAARPKIMRALEIKVFKEAARSDGIPEHYRTAVSDFLKNMAADPGSSFDPVLVGQGIGIDLERIFDDLNRDYFDGQIQATVIWGRDSKNRNRREFRFGSYDPSEKLIRVHPRLQQDFVPLSVIELTVYHEMCHQWKPPVRKRGKWWSHHREFLDKEKEYRFYREAKAWEKQQWKKLLKPVKSWMVLQEE